MSPCILVVEDEKDNRQILRDLLGNAGYELTEAANGEEAIAAVANGRPDPYPDGYPIACYGRLRGYPTD